MSVGKFKPNTKIQSIFAEIFHSGAKWWTEPMDGVIDTEVAEAM